MGSPAMERFDRHSSVWRCGGQGQVRPVNGDRGVSRYKGQWPVSTLRLIFQR